MVRVKENPIENTNTRLRKIVEVRGIKRSPIICNNEIINVKMVNIKIIIISKRSVLKEN
jgi:acetolactate synthase regulatory subunit